MAYFKKECEPDEPRVSLVNRISKTSQPEEVLHIVLRYLARETVLNEDTAKTFCELVEDLTENNKLSVENFTKIFESLITKSKISLSDFDSAKMRLLQSNTLIYNSKVKMLPGNEGIVKEPYPNILQFIYDLYQKDQYNDNTLLILLLDTLREYVKNSELLTLNTTAWDNKKVHDGEMDQEKEQIASTDQTESNREDGKETKEEDPKDVTGVYIQGLLCGVLDDTVNLDECGELLGSGIGSPKNEILQYKKAYEDSLQKKTKRDEIFWIRFIVNMWNMNVIKEELKTSFLLKIVDTFLVCYLIPFNKYLDLFAAYTENIL